MSKNNEQRRAVFINKAFQGRFILNVLLVVILSGLCSALLIYWQTGGDLQAESQTAHANIETSLEHLGFSILFGNLVAMLIAGGAALLFILYASHKIAGPLFRFEKLCQQIGDGQLDTITKLREGDQLQDMGNAFEDMVNKLRHRRDERLQLTEKIIVQLEQLQQDQTVATQHSEQLEQMRQVLAQLQDVDHLT
jgi:nitrogen fixation/metabolism regulation signal transduction histidine kinase